MDQIQQRHAPAGVALGQRHHQAQVGLKQMSTGCLAVARNRGELTFALVAQALTGFEQVLGVQTRLDPLGQIHLVLGGQQSRFPDPVQIHAHKIGGWTLGVQVAVKPGGGGVCHWGAS